MTGLIDPLARYRQQVRCPAIGEEGQSHLARSRVAIVGMGALGSVLAETLARAGIGFLRLIDRDFVELSNLQRQVLYTEQDVAERWPKSVAAAKAIGQINSTITVEPHVVDITASTILPLLSDVHLALDATDNFETRFLLNEACIEKNIPWILGGCLGTTGQTMTIIPGISACLACLFEGNEGPPGETCDSAGILGPAIQVVASLQAVAALKLCTKQAHQIRQELTVVDVWLGTWRTVSLENLAQTGCPVCRQGQRHWLNGQKGSQSQILCGRNAVQISPSERRDVSLNDLAHRLSPAGTVTQNPYLLRFKPADVPCELTLFRDGRAVIQGTEDLTLARSLYTRYVGL